MFLFAFSIVETYCVLESNLSANCIPKELEKIIVDLITDTLGMTVDKTEIEGYQIIDKNYIWR